MRKATRDTLARFKILHETLLYHCHLLYSNIKPPMLALLRVQVCCLCTRTAFPRGSGSAAGGSQGHQEAQLGSWALEHH
jgi:hypothetical protein